MKLTDDQKGMLYIVGCVVLIVLALLVTSCGGELVAEQKASRWTTQPSSYSSLSHQRKTGKTTGPSWFRRACVPFRLNTVVSFIVPPAVDVSFPPPARFSEWLGFLVLQVR